MKEAPATEETSTEKKELLDDQTERKSSNPTINPAWADDIREAAASAGADESRVFEARQLAAPVAYCRNLTYI